MRQLQQPGGLRGEVERAEAARCDNGGNGTGVDFGVKLKQLRLLVVTMVGMEQVGTVDDKVGEDDDRDARENRGKVTGCRETGRKEMCHKETGRKKTGRKDTGRKETG